MHVVITGGAGFIGSHIAGLFAGEGYKVTVFDNLSSGKKGNLSHISGKINLVKGDIRNFNSLKKTFKGADYVIHNAALIYVPESFKDPFGYNDANVNGTLNVLMAARQTKVKKVAFASSAAIYGNAKTPINEMTPLKPMSVYALNKIAGEQYCKFFNDFYGLNTVVLRYFNAFGPRQNPESAYAAAVPIFIRKFLQNKKADVFGDGEQTRDFIYVKNIALANLLALKNEKANGLAMNIASGRKISINSLLKKISPDLGAVHLKSREGDIRHSLADVKLSKSILGNYEKYSFEEGLKETIEYYKNCQ
ncbi:MAG TPA: NAD-dependent epimerase/dehydratase family protein [Candidatus Nanoarchaeia archaeon]|nr:NAD-dependent epimerase/dehydratase family protein [Candidatus Nanoarchaeia archaeon]